MQTIALNYALGVLIQFMYLYSHTHKIKTLNENENQYTFLAVIAVIDLQTDTHLLCSPPSAVITFLHSLCLFALMFLIMKYDR